MVIPMKVGKSELLTNTVADWSKMYGFQLPDFFHVECRNFSLNEVHMYSELGVSWVVNSYNHAVHILQ